MLHKLASVCDFYVYRKVTMSVTNSALLLANNEVKLLSLVWGQDLKSANYGAAAPFARLLDLGDDGPFSLLRVPGIGLDQNDPRNQEFLREIKGLGQNDPRNQELLCEVEDLFIGIGENDEIPHDPKVTAKGGHGNKPVNFFSGPLLLGGWPTWTPIALD